MPHCPIIVVNDQPCTSEDDIKFIHHLTLLSLRKRSHVFPQSVCFDLPMIPACDLSTCPTQSHVHFLWGQRRVPGSRWLHGSRAVPRPCYTELPQQLMSWRLQHQRGHGSGGRAGPSLTLPWPLHHNMRVRSHSLTFTFLMICVYQWPSSALCFPSCCCSWPFF